MFVLALSLGISGLGLAVHSFVFISCHLEVPLNGGKGAVGVRKQGIMPFPLIRERACNNSTFTCHLGLLLKYLS